MNDSKNNVQIVISKTFLSGGGQIKLVFQGEEKMVHVMETPCTKISAEFQEITLCKDNSQKKPANKIPEIFSRIV